ncbi:MAG: Hsp20 family protein [Alphaproteobacteria bacterium]
MTVLTPFPTRTNTNETFTNDNVASLRTEINRIVNNAFENTATGQSQMSASAQTIRTVILNLQAEINRIIGLLIQSVPAAPAAPMATPVAQPAFAPFGYGPAPFFATPYTQAPAAPFPVVPYGQAQGYGVAPAPVPGFAAMPPALYSGFPSYAPVAPSPFTAAPVPAFGAVAMAGQPFLTAMGAGSMGAGPTASGSAGTTGFNPAAFGALLLTEINRVFSQLLQDVSVASLSGGIAPTGYAGTAPFGAMAGVPGFGGSVVNPSTVAFLQNEINRAFNTVLQDQGSFGESSSSFTPRINLFETTDTIEIEADLPGFDDSDIDLSANGNVVTIKGWRRRAANEGVREFHILERGFGTFSRSLTLPFEVDPQLIRASFNEGVLTVEITKPETARENTHRIDIARAS